VDNPDSTARVRADLPQMPDEVINEWLKPYVEQLGWPPSTDIYQLPANRWNGILSHKPIAFWARVKWRFEQGSLEFSDLDLESRQAICGLRDAHYSGIKNAYSEITDGKERLLSILKFVIQNECIPSSIILLESGSQFSVVDGHHRLIAYYLNREPEFRKLFSLDTRNFNCSLNRWVGAFTGWV
jgi:hypothetical protein